MKKIIYGILMFILLLGCSENLEQVYPMGPTGDDFFKTERDLQFAVVAAYAGLSNERGIWNTDMWGVEAMSDNAYAIADAPYTLWDSYEYDPTDQLVTDFYRYLYIAINRANLVLLNAPQIEGIAQSDMDNYMGQVYFLRGYEYFLLTLLYEDVPIVLEPSDQPEGFSLPASSASEVYDQAIGDLLLAEQLLPETQSEAGRIVKKAATAMLAKVYLFGADELNKSEWYALAEQKAKEVINSGQYELINDPAKSPAQNLIHLFATDNTLEDIFSVQHYSSGGWNNGNVAGQFSMAINPRYDRGKNLWGFGWMYHFEAIDKLWDDADSRKRVSLFFEGDSVVTVTGAYKGIYGTTHNRADARFDSSGPKKFWYFESNERVVGQTDLDAKVLRYADLLLIHAEADLMADGNLSAAGAASFNEVRTRAGLPELSTGAINRGVILEERRWELFLECHRWFDLMRTKTAEQAFPLIKQYDTNNNDNEKNGFVPQKHYKLPYPQSALDRNPELVQKSVWGAEE